MGCLHFEHRIIVKSHKITKGHTCFSQETDGQLQTTD